MAHSRVKFHNFYRLFSCAYVSAASSMAVAVAVSMSTSASTSLFVFACVFVSMFVSVSIFAYILRIISNLWLFFLSLEHNSHTHFVTPLSQNNLSYPSPLLLPVHPSTTTQGTLSTSVEPRDTNQIEARACRSAWRARSDLPRAFG